jgi:hypothetical protein
MRNQHWKMGARMKIQLFAGLVAAAATIVACGGGSSDKTPTTSPATSPAATTAAGDTTPSAGSSGGSVFDETQAKALIDEASIKPGDVGADWKIASDTPVDNATAASLDPDNASGIERCGRLWGRTVTTQPADIVSAYLTGLSVSTFTQLTVYKTAEGATDCSNDAAARLQAPGALARAFGTVFTNPDVVTVLPLTYEQVGDGSFAMALTGDTNASGTTVQIQIVMVAFRKGNTTAVVGIAQSPLTNPDPGVVKPYVDLTLQRITANQ